MRSRAIAVTLGVLTIAATLAAQTTDRFAGTWHLNVEKSKFSPGPAPKSIVLKFEAAANGIKASSETALANGQTRQAEFTAPNDGKDVPLTGSPIADTVSVKSDGNKRVRVDKKGGKVVMTYNGTLSPDGKTFTVDQKGTDEKGQAVHNQLVFEKH